MLPRCIRLAALAMLLATGGAALSGATDKVDINRASLAELEQLPGVTPAWAQRIIRFRPYRTKLDLLQEGILPTELYLKIRDGVVAHHAQH